MLFIKRDSWDDWLTRQCDNRDWRIKAVAHVASLTVAGSRKYLALLMRAGEWISSGFSRQMEFDADRYEAAIVGTEVFEQIQRRLPLLTIASKLAWDDAFKEWSIQRLPEDVPLLVAARASWLPSETVGQIVEQSLAQSTGRWDTHPCMSDRLANVRREETRGIFRMDGDAARLFDDLPQLCKRATLLHYEGFLAVDSRSVRLIPMAETASHAEAARECDRAVRQLFHAPVEFCSRWFRLPDAVNEHANTTYCPQWNAEDLERGVETDFLQFAALMIRKCGVAVKPASFRLDSTDVVSIEEQQTASARAIEELMNRYQKIAKPVADRFETIAVRAANGRLSIVVSAQRQIPIPDFQIAWSCYAALSQFQGDLMDIGRRVCAARIVRENARLFPAAVCANLLDDLERFATSRIDRILAASAETPAVIAIDPRQPQTVGAQLAIEGGSPTERIDRFISRAQLLAARALGQLSWFVLTACDAPASSSADVSDDQQFEGVLPFIAQEAGKAPEHAHRHATSVAVAAEDTTQTRS